MRFTTLAATSIAVATTAAVATPTWGPWGAYAPWAPWRNDYGFRVQTINSDCAPDACETRGYYYGNGDRFANNQPCCDYQNACSSLGDLSGPFRADSFCKNYPEIWTFDAHCTVTNLNTGEALSYTGAVAERQRPRLVEVYESDGRCVEIDRGICEVRNPDNSIARFRRNGEFKK